MTEKEFSRKFRKLLEEKGIFSVNLQEISSEPSCPDTLLLDSLSGVSGLFELKILRKGESRISFQTGQTQWLREWEEKGGISGVVIFFPLSGEILAAFGGISERIERARGVQSAEGLSRSLPRGVHFTLGLLSSGLSDRFRAFLHEHPNSPLLRQGRSLKGL